MPSESEVELYLSIKTSLPDDTFEVLGIRGEEHISRLFHYTVEMGSHDIDVDLAEILGKEVTIKVAQEDGTVHSRHGVVVRISQKLDADSAVVYNAELCPWLWLLTKTSDCRIFQNKTVPEIIQEIFGDLGFTNFKLQLTNSYSPREYCVQYSETHFDFVSRLMEDEGIFYFFEHNDSHHIMVLADDADAHVACPGLGSAVHYKQFGASWTEENAINGTTLEHQIVLNEYKMTDYNFETPSTNLLVSVQGAAASGAKLAMYEYPGGYSKKDDGEKRAKTRIETMEFPMKMIRGQSNSRDFIAGYKFTLSGHDRSSMNGSYVIRSLIVTVTQDGYENTFMAFPDSVPFRPHHITRKPTMHGYQIATVVGKSGEEIWTDKYGRVKVHFPWDTRSKSDEGSSCWIRVAQAWAGKSWGTLSIPRIGAEVIISFLDGDPDRPLIVGTVFNAQQTVPYTLPDNKTRTTIKTNSSKGGGGSNEMRFEDMKDAEEIYVHAQKDYNIEVVNDRTTSIGANNTLTVGGDDEESYEKKRTISVAKQDTESYGNTRTITVSGNESESYGKDRKVTVSGNQTTTISKNETRTVDGEFTESVKKDTTMNVGKKLHITAGDEIVLKTGDAEIIMKKNGDITIKGKKIDIKASGDITIKGSKIKEN